MDWIAGVLGHSASIPKTSLQRTGSPLCWNNSAGQKRKKLWSSFASSKNTQDKLGYHLLREDYARAIGDTELEKQERLLSEQLKTQLGNKKGESRIPASAKESKYAFFCWLSFSVGLALFGIISNIATGTQSLDRLEPEFLFWACSRSQSA